MIKTCAELHANDHGKGPNVFGNWFLGNFTIWTFKQYRCCAVEVKKWGPLNDHEHSSLSGPSDSPSSWRTSHARLNKPVFP